MNNSKFRGTLKTWKDDRGFGFIKPDDDSKDVFVHISAFDKTSRRPWKGDVIFYQIEKDRGGKVKAVNARIGGVKVKNINVSGMMAFVAIGFAVFGYLIWMIAKNPELIASTKEIVFSWFK